MIPLLVDAMTSSLHDMLR